jgi:hypothetical protein
MSRRQRDRHWLQRAQRTWLRRRRGEPDERESVQRRLDAGRKEILFRGVIVRPMQRPAEAAGQEAARGELPRGVAYEAITPSVRNQLIDDLLLGTARQLRTRKGER